MADAILGRFINAVVEPIILLFFAVALLVFLWGIFKLIKGADEEKARDEGKQAMLYGIIGFFIMVGVYGLIRIITGTFNLPNPF